MVLPALSPPHVFSHVNVYEQYSVAQIELERTYVPL